MTPARATTPAFSPPEPTRIGPRLFEWGSRTFVMGIVNVTPDSFSGDGLLARAYAAADLSSSASHAPSAASPGASAVDRAVAQARHMVDEGADILDVGGESTRPAHEAVAADEESARVVPVIAAIHAALPHIPISVDTSKPAVAEAAVAAGAALINDVWGVSADDAIARVAAAGGVALVLMHNRTEPRYDDFVAELIEDLRAAVDRAEAAGVPRGDLIVDPGFGFGKSAEHNLTAMRELAALRVLGRPILLGTSRKSTLGRVLGGLPAEDRLEGTLATTALGIAGGADIVRVHDVRANVRTALVADAIVRGWYE